MAPAQLRSGACAWQAYRAACTLAQNLIDRLFFIVFFWFRLIQIIKIELFQKILEDR